MFANIQREWRCLKDSPPGKRFQRRYRRVRERRARAHEGREDEPTRILRFSIAFVLLAVGICLILFPLVYIPFLAAGTALLASDSLTCARLLDKAESGVRLVWAWFKAKAGLPPQSAKVIGAILGLGCLALTGRYCYNAFMH
jgi:hypothetical protein